MQKAMDPTSACGSSSDTGMIYEAAMARRAQDQQRIQGAAALRLIQSAAEAGAGAGQARPLPPDATISIRV